MVWLSQPAKIAGTVLRGFMRRGGDTSAYDLLGCKCVLKADANSYNEVCESFLPCASGTHSPFVHIDLTLDKDVVQT